MSTFTAPLTTFVLEPHPNADTLSIAKVGGWQCVVRTEDFKDETIGVYLPLDTIADKDHPILSFLGGSRIKTVRLRGEISQGLLLPYSQVKAYMTDHLGMSDQSISKVEWFGKDFSGILRVRRWLAPETMNLGRNALPSDPRFSKYTDIENIRNYLNVISIGDEVEISEKLHGCLEYGSCIDMPDGTTEKIGKLVNSGYRGYVMGYKDGKIEPVRVTNTFHNGQTDNWLRIKILANLGRGNWYRKIICTPEHQIYLPEKDTYAQASELKVGDFVLLKRKTIEPTSLEKQILYGKLLGDASLSRQNCHWSMQYGHTIDQKDYSEWTAHGLKNIIRPTIGYYTSGYGSKMIRRTTVASYFITKQFQNWYDASSGVKIVPEDVIDKITPIAIAFWYMDDGSLCDHPDQIDRCQFAVCGFDRHSVDNCAAILKKYDVDVSIRTTTNKTSNLGVGHWRLYLNERNADKLFLLIAPYIPPSMQYKLPIYYRGHSGWLPQQDTISYKPHTVPHKIISIEHLKPKNTSKYDLETESSNFFTAGILVHNSSARYALADDDYMIGSRNIRLDPESEDSVWTKVAKKLDLKAKLTRLKNISCSNHVGIYGEIVGPKIQDLAYGCVEPTLYVYDIIIDGGYVGPELSRAYCAVLELPYVPVLKIGPLEEADFDLRNGKSTLASHVREGIVIKPSIPRYDPAVGRVILKLIGEDYLLRKNAVDKRDI